MADQRKMMVVEECTVPVDELFKVLDKVSTLLDDNREVKETEYDNLVYNISGALRETKDLELKNKLLLAFKNRTDYLALFLPTQGKRNKFESMRNKDLMKMRRIAWGY